MLYVTPRQNWPLTSGARLRDFHLLRQLAQTWWITFIGFHDDAVAPNDLRDALSFCDKVFLIPKPPKYSAAKIVQGLWSKTPLPVLNYDSAAMRDCIRTQLTTDNYDLAHLESIHLGCYRDLFGLLTPKLPLVYDWHNIESELLVRYRKSAGLLRSIYAAITASKLERFENELLRDSSGHLVCSDREKTALQSREPSARIATIENGVDVSYFSPPAGVKAGGSRQLIFVGAMHYHANVEAATSFAKDIFPLVQSQFPDLQLTLVGANPPPSVVALGSLPGVHVTGTVPDVRPYYQSAFAAIVPIATGSGTRLKILEAMAARTPVISTSVGCEGLEVEPGRHLLLANRATDWINAISQLNKEATRQQLVANAFELMQRRYDWPAIASRLNLVYEQWTLPIE